MTREEAIKDLITIKEYFEEECGATPICLEYAIDILSAEEDKKRKEAEWVNNYFSSKW